MVGPDPAFAASPSSQSTLSVPSGLQSGVGFADQWWAFIRAKSVWEDDFYDLLMDGQDYDRLRGLEYRAYEQRACEGLLSHRS